MASNEEVAELRLLTDTPDLEAYPNLTLSATIDAVGMNGAAASIWRQKAAKYAALVDVSESGSSRSMSQLFKNATSMAEHFQKLADAEGGSVSGRTRVHTIERA